MFGMTGRIDNEVDIKTPPVTLAVLKMLAIYVEAVSFARPALARAWRRELPVTATQWLLALLLAVPLHLVGELIGRGLWNNKAARFVEQKPSGKQLFVLRMLYAFLIIVAFSGAISGASWFWNLLKG